MAGTTTKSIPSVDTRQNPGRDLADLIRQHNKLVDDVEALRAAFSGHVHGGVTAGAANTSAVAILAAATLTGAKVGDRSGTAV